MPQRGKNAVILHYPHRLHFRADYAEILKERTHSPIATAIEAVLHSPVALMMDQSSKLSDSKEKDRISNLPDAILSHILCFMPTKYAARTSLLSTRWKSIWTSVHIIDLDSLGERRHNEQSSGFMDFVDRLLLLRNSPNLNKFRLQCQYGYYNPYRFHSWICTVIKLNVKELVLNFTIEQLVVELPQSLFTSVNLVVLKLAGDVFFGFPMPVFWPSLKVFHLHSLTFLDDDSFQNILSGCPVLEELDIERTNLGDNIKTLCICSSTLKKLRIYNCFRVTSLQHSVVIKAPVLEIFQLTDMYSVFDVDELPSLVKANFAIYFDNYKSEDYYNGVVGMLGKISNVQHLELSNVIPKVVIEAFGYNTLLFHNLTHLHLHLQISDNHWSTLLDLLGHMPKLKVLVFNKNKGHKNWELCLWSGEPESVPKCLSLCLEAIEFSGFAGYKGEMKLVRYLLGNAMVLKKLTITSWTRNKKIKANVLKFPRGSSTCQLKLLYYSYPKYRNPKYRKVVEWL